MSSLEQKGRGLGTFLSLLAFSVELGIVSLPVHSEQVFAMFRLRSPESARQGDRRVYVLLHLESVAEGSVLDSLLFLVD